MDVTNSNNVITAELLSEALKKWFMQKRLTNVSIKENFGRVDGDNSDYVVIYECVFEPLDLFAARVEVYMAEDGSIGIGLEKWSRLFARNGKKVNTSLVVSGHEPCKLNLDYLLELLEILSKGDFFIKGFSFPRLGIQASKVYIDSASLSNLSKIDSPLALQWLKGTNNIHDQKLFFSYEFVSWG